MPRGQRSDTETISSPRGAPPQPYLQTMHLTAFRPDIHLRDAKPLKGNLKAREERITFIRTSRDCGQTFFSSRVLNHLMPRRRTFAKRLKIDNVADVNYTFCIVPFSQVEDEVELALLFVSFTVKLVDRGWGHMFTFQTPECTDIVERQKSPPSEMRTRTFAWTEMLTH